ncbi:MAG: hypothetical protein QXP47_03075 [Candidatus Nezhaarchaeales archaeon]|nr:MAG: hypothetical protein DSO06_02080 [Candidatus Nezhaarchaeota archaeon WYZ-LMO8]TDA36838.1 MAG: hypothetical protein DSO05_02135 [Candidatus Nezhaarchaeota archaeon WYZ-LMO7]
MLFIAGGGFFGFKALHEASSYSLVLVADVEGRCPASKDVDLVIPLDKLDREHLGKFKSILIVGNASDALSKVIRLGLKPEIVVPAIPRHFAADFLKRELEMRRLKVIPSPDGIKKALKLFPKELILNLDFESSTFTFSCMPSWSRCIVPCNQPGVCPVTGRLKLKPITKMAEEILCFTDLALVLESRKTGNFAGGFDFETL